MKKFKINKTFVGSECKTYFIADIAANFDGNLKRAKKLIELAAKSGADAAKFQNFRAETIVSDKNFLSLKTQLSHQSKWKKSVFEVYKKAELPLEWTLELKETCYKFGIDYFTAPYDINFINYLKKFVSAWKVGSGDITWHEIILEMAKHNKPIIIATGASSLSEVSQIVKKVLKKNKKIILMQCNTNYTASNNNFNFINLKVLSQYKKMFPNVVLGLSDHTLGHETVLGSIALGARVIEKHFTDSNKRGGPDHKFSMNPLTWEKMIEASRNLESAMGDGIKKIEKNELQTSVIQRRGILTSKNLKKNEIIKKEHLVFLRPCKSKALAPYMYRMLLGRKAKKNINFHEVLNFENTK
jgi:N-acetylneuraminate synthase